MGIFDSFDDEESSKISTKEEVGRAYATFHTIENKMDSFLERIENDTISNVEIRQVILNYFNMYLDYGCFNDPAQRSTIQALWQNEKFLSAMLYIFKKDFVNSPNQLTADQRICVNKLAFDYKYKKPQEEKKKEVEELLLALAKIVDRPYILALNTKMYEDSAFILCMSRFSSPTNWTCINRLNYFIIRFRENFSYQDIIYIYGVLYPSGFSSLFTYTMIDIDKNGLTEDQIEVYNNISIAILAILDSMPNSEMHSVLQYYANYIFLMYDKKEYRFSLKEIPKYYKRTLAMISNMEAFENIILP